MLIKMNKFKILLLNEDFKKCASIHVNNMSSPYAGCHITMKVLQMWDEQYIHINNHDSLRQIQSSSWGVRQFSRSGHQKILLFMMSCSGQIDSEALKFEVGVGLIGNLSTVCSCMRWYHHLACTDCEFTGKVLLYQCGTSNLFVTLHNSK